MKTVFTIVARNYVALANILGSSLKKYNPDVNFYIVVADSYADEDRNSFNTTHNVVKSQDLQIADFEQMAFKYNITEMCTAIKPAAFDYFFKNASEKVIYFDPDIMLFSNLNDLFDELDLSNIILTPHYCFPEKNYTGLFKEGNILFAGIFNLGFCAISNSLEGRKIVDWWNSKLLNWCFADKTEGLHVDQKWMDFVPSFFDKVKIEHNLGCNVAIWNWHEREIYSVDSIYYVKHRGSEIDGQKLVFYHFSNYHFKKADKIDNFVPINLDKYVDINPINELYSSLLIQAKVAEEISSCAYRYNSFNNNVPISQFQRRFYRRLLEKGILYQSPFETDKNSFYALLDKYNLLSANGASDKVNEVNFTGFDKKIRMINAIMRILSRLIGFDRYSLLCKFMFRYVRPENQAFLIKEYEKSLPFINENRYINI